MLSIAPQPSQLELIIIACTTNIGCNINLELMAQKLELDDQIVGKKMLGIVEQGDIKKKGQHKKNKSKTVRKDFSNQCTIIVKISPDKKINLKIFGDGEIVITGGLTKSDGTTAINILKNKIRNLSGDYKINPDRDLFSIFETSYSYLKYINKHYLIFLKLFSIFENNIDLKLDLILNKKYIKNFKSNTDDIQFESFVTVHDQNDMTNYIKLVQIYNILHLYFTDKLLLEKLNNSSDNVHQIIHKLYNLDKITLPITFEPKIFDRDNVIEISNYNTMFNANFSIDRENFTQILNEKYSRNGTIISAKFEPTVYQGIIIKYISRVLCKPDCHSTAGKNSHCPCKLISIFVFQEGKIIVTGGRHWDQINDGYNIITNILKDEYSNIVVEKQIEQNVVEIPSQIQQQNPDGSTSIYINKNDVIGNNPRNVYILKRLELLHLYE